MRGVRACKKAHKDWKKVGLEAEWGNYESLSDLLLWKFMKSFGLLFCFRVVHKKTLQKDFSTNNVWAIPLSHTVLILSCQKLRCETKPQEPMSYPLRITNMTFPKCSLWTKCVMQKEGSDAKLEDSSHGNIWADVPFLKPDALHTAHSP